MKADNKKIRWKETVLDSELLSEFSKYGVSMIEEIEDPSDISIYDLEKDILSKKRSELVEYDEKESGANSKKENVHVINDESDRQFRKKRNINKDDNNKKSKKKKELNKSVKECIVNPEEHWEDYYELKDRLSEWTNILEIGVEESETKSKRRKANENSMEELKSPSLIIHPSILKGLSVLNFLKPTPIQSACLIPAIRDRKDIIGVAETGSGKTLAYGIPIISNIMFTIQRRREKRERRELNEDMLDDINELEYLSQLNNDSSNSHGEKDEVVMELESLGFQTANFKYIENKVSDSKIEEANSNSSEDMQALIILPSRELAIQVRDHLREVGKYTGLGIHAFVGGLSLEKQERIIIRKRVQIAIGTPGRLSSLILENDFEYEKNQKFDFSESNKESLVRFKLDELHYLVLDEADRLVEQGHYKELRDILQYIYITDKKSNKVIRKIQTYLFSATLSLPNHLHPKFSKLNRRNNSKKQINSNKNLNSAFQCTTNKAMESLLQYIKLRENQVFIVDLSRFKTKLNNNEITESHASNKLVNTDSGSIKLPKGLTISIIKCEVDEVEMRLVLYLLMLFSPRWNGFGKTSGNRGNNSNACNICPISINKSKVLLFVNSISYVYRLVPLLSLCLVCNDLHQKDLPYQKNKNKCNKNCIDNKLKIMGIHGKMLQKQRIQTIESFRSSKSSVLVCTDVLARGLDIQDIDVVIHLQPPRNVSLMIHRSGRTARASNEGECVLFCTPKDVPSYTKGLRAISLSIDSIDAPIQMREITSSQVSHVQKRLEFANEIEKLEHSILRKKKSNSWMINKANEADLELSDQEDYSLTPEQIKAIRNLSHKRNILLEHSKKFQNFC